jgi:hypothetical protein
MSSLPLALEGAPMTTSKKATPKKYDPLAELGARLLGATSTREVNPDDLRRAVVSEAHRADNAVAKRRAR